MKKYFDPKYDRIVDETVVKKQYEYFRKQGSTETFEEFAEANFSDVSDSKCLEVVYGGFGE